MSLSSTFASVEHVIASALLDASKIGHFMLTFLQSVAKTETTVEALTAVAMPAYVPAERVAYSALAWVVKLIIDAEHGGTTISGVNASDPTSVAAAAAILAQLPAQLVADARGIVASIKAPLAAAGVTITAHTV